MMEVIGCLTTLFETWIEFLGPGFGVDSVQKVLRGI